MEIEPMANRAIFDELSRGFHILLCCKQKLFTSILPGKKGKLTTVSEEQQEYRRKEEIVNREGTVVHQAYLK